MSNYGLGNELGSFECVSGEFTVSDPCYTDDVWCKGKLKNVKKGKWYAETFIKETGRYGTERIEVLGVCHESVMNSSKKLEYHKADFEVGVDSGQAGIFDTKYYRDGLVFEGGKVPEFGWGVEEGQGERWYGFCCDVTSGENSAGVIPFGAVSCSGYGDGGYTCNYCTNDDGEVVMVSITFIEDEDEEDEWDTYDGEFDDEEGDWEDD